MAKRTYYTTKDLVSFGNYLLSEQRKKWMNENNEISNRPKGSGMNEVYDADIANWKFHIKKMFGVDPGKA